MLWGQLFSSEGTLNQPSSVIAPVISPAASLFTRTRGFCEDSKPPNSFKLA